MDKPDPLRRPSRRLVYAFLALLPLAGCGASPTTASGSGKNGQDSAGTASGSHPSGASGSGPAAGVGQGGDHAKDPAYNAPARFTVQLGQVSALSKHAAIVMRRLVFTVVSNAAPADTVRDTVALDGNSGQTLKRVIKLKPKLNWVLQAKAFDQRSRPTPRCRAFSCPARTWPWASIT